MKRKSQSSLEYLLILAFAMGILIPAIYVFYSYSSNSREQLTDSIVMQIGSEIIENSFGSSLLSNAPKLPDDALLTSPLSFPAVNCR